MSTPTDFLNELVEERTAMNTAFSPSLQWWRRPISAGCCFGSSPRREAAHLTRTVVAACMGTSEAATGDPKASTIERFAAAVGKGINWEIVDVLS
ncbi:MAG: hypothetical protein M3Z66_10230 [Chloroflexota bacterium]|nr:hypothetical protein [Chloroflexota bacterium]